MDRLEVRTRRTQPIATVLVAVIMVPLGFASLVMGLTDGFGIVGVGLGMMMLATFGLVMWLARRGQTMSVRYFSEEGLERNDGRWLPWSDLQRVIYQIRTQPEAVPALWRTEIRFRNGETAWVLPQRVANLSEVGEFVSRLPCEHVEERV